MAKKVNKVKEPTTDLNNELVIDKDYPTIEEMNNVVQEQIDDEKQINKFQSVPVKIKPLSKQFKPLEKANNDEGNACFDVVATSMVITEKYIEYGLGFACEFPSNYKMIINPRSSISKYNLIMANAQGIVDSSYRDEVKVRFKVIPNMNVKFIYKDSQTHKNYSFDEIVATPKLKADYDNNLLKPIYNANSQFEESIIFGFDSPMKYSDLKIYQIGDKIAQIYMEEVLNTSFEYIDNNQELSKSKRNGGFGSTGE